MIVLRVLLGIFQSAIFPGLSYLISTWYTRREQQLRYAFLQSGEVTIVGLGAFLNYGSNHLDGKAGLRGWRWMFLVQGMLAIGKDILDTVAEPRMLNTTNQSLDSSRIRGLSISQRTLTRASTSLRLSSKLSRKLEYLTIVET